MMKLRVLLVTCLLLFVLGAAYAFAADDDEEEGEEDFWGEATIDHRLNRPFEYPSAYVAQPIVYSRRVYEVTTSFQYKFAKHYWDEDGDLVEGGFRSKKQTFNLGFAGGFTDRWSAGVNFPFVYKETLLTDPDGPNYRTGRDNTYGTTVEEAFIDFVDHHELWKLWEADLPQLGDVEVWSAYSLFRAEDPTTDIALEFIYKAPTGNDNPRRGSEVRTYLTTGTPDFYAGLAVKQQFFDYVSVEAHGGYNWRLPAATKYSPGEMDLADQVKGDFELALQWHDAKFFLSKLVLATEAHYMQRLWNSRFQDNQGNSNIVEDTPGYMASLEPKVHWQDFGGLLDHFTGDLFFGADIPMAGQRSFLVTSRSFFLPPLDLETYEAVGITYTLGLIKRWQ